MSDRVLQLAGSILLVVAVVVTSAVVWTHPFQLKSIENVRSIAPCAPGDDPTAHPYPLCYPAGDASPQP